MAKPWARIEIGYINHPKFLALNANAICLWHEAKNYCDRNHTDGVIPREALKVFRFRGVKAVELLLKPCGLNNPDGQPFAPLWEVHPAGYLMHDYLEHNDSAEEVSARLRQSEENRAADRERLRQWRANKLQRQAGETVRETPSETPSETVSETPLKRSIQKQKHLQQEKIFGEMNSPKPHPIKDFLALHEELFEKRTGNKPAKYTGKEAAISKRVIDRYGFAEASRLLRRFMALDNEFIAKAGLGLNVFESQINNILSERTRPVLADGPASDDRLARRTQQLLRPSQPAVRPA